MKSTELRVGNWVIENGQPLQVSLNNADFWHSENFEPIPLTPEILKQVGFKSSSGSVNQNVYLPPLKQYAKVFRLFSADKGYKYHNVAKVGFMPTIIHLHQLQNLYFALTGEELEIKL